MRGVQPVWVEIAVASERLDYRPGKLIVVLEQVARKPGSSLEFTPCEEREIHQVGNDECYNNLVVHGHGHGWLRFG